MTRKRDAAEDAGFLGSTASIARFPAGGAGNAGFPLASSRDRFQFGYMQP